MDGGWSKVIGTDRFSKLPFHAEYGVTERFPTDAAAEPASFAGRWAVTFDNHGEPEPAVAIIEQDGGHVTGTFLTPTGDFRFLEGAVSGRSMSLSCFDGGHAFLFKAELDNADRINGKFWSRDNWEDSWTAERDPNAELKDSYAMTHLKEGRINLHSRFPI